MGHISIEYRGFSICEKCDIILCPLNSLDECKGKPIAGAREYIDRLKSGGIPTDANAKRDAEIERLRAMIHVAREFIHQMNRCAEIICLGNDCGGMRAREVYKMSCAALEELDRLGTAGDKNDA